MQEEFLRKLYNSPSVLRPRGSMALVTIGLRGVPHAMAAASASIVAQITFAHVWRALPKACDITAPWGSRRHLGQPRRHNIRSPIASSVTGALGLVGLVGRSPYAANKCMVVQFTGPFLKGRTSDGVPANPICPGNFLSERNHPIADDEATLRSISGRTARYWWRSLAGCLQIAKVS